jgi:CheY-like chemotaxis protein
MATADTPYQWSYVFDEHTRILVVDDDPILREFASVYLTSPVSEVEAAPDAEAALSLLSSKAFDVVLVDIGCRAWTASSWSRPCVRRNGCATCRSSF